MLLLKIGPVQFNRHPGHGSAGVSEVPSSQRVKEESQKCLDLVASAWAEGDRVADAFKDIASLWRVCGCPWLGPSAHVHLDLAAAWAVQAVGFEGGRYGAETAEGEGRDTFGSAGANWGPSCLSYSQRRQWRG